MIHTLLGGKGTGATARAKFCGEWHEVVRCCAAICEQSIVFPDLECNKQG